MRPLITGATGFVGKQLLRRVERPVVLSRNAAQARTTLGEYLFDAYDWNAANEPAPAAAFAGVDTIFHLAGEPIAEGRWNAEKKFRLRESRVAGTRNLVETLARLPPAERPKVLVSASAVGYYGSRGDEILDESKPPVDDFLGEICISWEREAARAEALGIRVCMLRIGIVLGEGGGALAKMVPAFKSWAGSRLGSGEQWVPWIHLQDLVDLLLFVAERESLRGPINATAPQPVTNAEFTRLLSNQLGALTLLPPVPAFALKTMLGEFGAVLMASQRVVPKVALDAGFRFRYPTLEAALRDILT
jgi:uncharacterized protein (TIGR01777 family)